MDGVISDSQLASVGAIIRDDPGRVRVALSKHLPLPLEPLEAKAKALEEGVFFCMGVDTSFCNLHLTSHGG